jgi:hypothetical protein
MRLGIPFRKVALAAHGPELVQLAVRLADELEPSGANPRH